MDEQGDLGERPKRAAQEIRLRLEVPGARQPSEIRISMPWVWALALVGVAGGVVMVMALLALSSTIPESQRARRLQAENDSLRSEFLRLEAIEREMETLREANRQILLLAGVPVPEPAAPPGQTTTDQGLDGNWRRSYPYFLPATGIISRRFARGPEGSVHLGVDIAGQSGSPVVASGGGVVIEAGQSDLFGRVLTLDHGDGIETFYGHNQELLVGVGDSVLAGERIALLGSTGRSSAPHLHFEVRVDGDPVDPEQFVAALRARRKD